eukprot:SAG22_NODE_993_length_6123_cov_15.091799_12_plen_36_part_00
MGKNEIDQVDKIFKMLGALRSVELQGKAEKHKERQ